ncbi:MAG: outer membrane lipoprotein chaperone LolA, partial [Thioalkalispiraceae bacterium]
MLRSLLFIILVSLCNTTFAKTLQDHFSRMVTWQADFVQTVVNNDTQTTTKSQGKLWLLRPDRFRLEYLKPYKQLYVADGIQLWFYDEDLEQVTVKPQEHSLDQTPAMILSQPKALSSSYTITSQQKGERLSYTLKPKKADTGFDHIVLVFKNEQLAEMHMYDHFAQRTSLIFSHAQRNHKVPAKTFQFTPPPNV